MKEAFRSVLCRPGSGYPRAVGLLVLTLSISGTTLAQQAPKFSTQAPAEGAGTKSGSEHACANERKRIAALSELNVTYAEKISLLEQKIKELEKKK